MTLKSYALMLALFIAVTITALPQAGFADVITHVTTGAQKIKGQNLSGAKQQAVTNALEQAVEFAFAKLVSPDVFAANLEFLHTRLLPAAQDFVVTYRVLNGIEYQGRYLVGVESKISLDMMENQLKKSRIIKTGQDKPVVLLLIAEETPDAPSPLHWWSIGAEPYTSSAEAVIRQQLQSNRIPFARQPSVYPAHTIAFNSAYDAGAAMALGKALKADMVVLGKAHAAESANRMGDQRTFDADIDLTVYALESKAKVGRITTNATAKSEDEYQGTAQAMDKAAAIAGKDLTQQINTYWNQAMRKEHRFDLTLEGDNFLTRFIALKRRMRDIRDIENMLPKEIGSHHAVMEVHFKGSARQFADAILLKTFQGFGIEIQEVTDDQVKIRFTETGQPASEQVQAPIQQAPAPEIIQEKIDE